MPRKNQLLKDAEISAFCHQINMVIKAGLPTYYGISLLMDEAEDEATKALLKAIYEPMEQGATLYQAIKPLGVFPHYMVSMVELGETTGRLEEVLDSLTVYYEREAEIAQGIKHALRYPLIMTLLMIVILLVMIREIVPIFADVYQELGSGLSGSAQTLMNISTFLNRYLFIFILCILAVAMLGFLFIKTPMFKKWFHKSRLSQTIAAGRFANCMYLALASGLDTDRGLELAHTLIDNTLMREKITRCKDLIKKGEAFSKSILTADIFSKVYAGIITIGAKTGSMDDVMLKISNAYEEESNDRIRRFVSVLEPSLIIILSFFIGLILVSFLLPLLGIMSNIG